MASTALAPLSISSSDGNSPSPLSVESGIPPSPAAPSTESEFLSNLLHALLSSDGSLPCPLPADFSAALLRNDEDATTAESGRLDTSLAEGVPSYPLYKQLARALSEWIVTSAFPQTMEPMPGIAEDEPKKAKIAGWTPTVVKLGSSLLELGKGVGFQLHVQEPYFSQLKGWRHSAFQSITPAQGGGIVARPLDVGEEYMLSLFVMEWSQSPLASLRRNVVVNFSQIDVKRYSTFQEMLEVEGLSSVLPGVASIDEGVQVYRAFYSEAREQVGVLGIHVCHPSNTRQPFEILHDLLNELHVEGVRALLGMRSTMGTIEDALPPPTSALLSSFLSIQHETLPGSKLTVGARALAKHVHRCSNGWWGVFTGTEPAKNEFAFRKICGMMKQAIWLNVHSVPIPVFEIRVRDGYGARWSADGSQFRGFLEPPMDEGYFNKWRH